MIRIAAIIGFILAISILLLAGCGGKTAKKDDMCFAVMFRSAFNPYFQEMEKGIRDTAAANKVKVIVLTNDKMTREEQDDIFKRLIERGIKALIIMPEALSEAKKNCIPMILEANRLNIPVIFIHSRITDEVLKETGARVECRISCDNEKGGILAGEYIAQKLKGVGRVLLIEGSDDSLPGKRRTEGFFKELKKYPGIQVVKGPYGNWDRDQGFKSCREMLDKHSDIKAIFTHNDLMALGASDAVDFAKVEKPVIVGFDGTQQGIKAIQEGRMDATVNQSPYDIGKYSIENALKIIRGEHVPPQIYTRTELITGEKLKLPFK